MENFNYQTTCRTILADLYTPVAVYMRLRDLYPQSALMESSDYHTQNNARSFIGINPIASVAVAHGLATVTYPDGNVKKIEIDENFWVATTEIDVLAEEHGGVAVAVECEHPCMDFLRGLE